MLLIAVQSASLILYTQKGDSSSLVNLLQDNRAGDQGIRMLQSIHNHLDFKPYR